MDLLLFPAVFMGIYGVYKTLAACVPFEFVVCLKRSGYSIEPLDSRKTKVSTFFSGILFLVGSLFFALLFMASPLGLQLRIWLKTIA